MGRIESELAKFVVAEGPCSSGPGTSHLVTKVALSPYPFPSEGYVVTLLLTTKLREYVNAAQRSVTETDIAGVNLGRAEMRALRDKLNELLGSDA